MKEEIHLGVAILEFNIKSGGFITVFAGTMYADVNASAKQIFEDFIEPPLDLKNKFFIMKVEGTVDDEFAYNFYTIRTNSDSKIEDIHIINPNSLDHDLLVDAIVGCKITDKFAVSCTDAVIRKCIVLENNEFKWTPDAKDRLKKVHSLRLKEFYQKLKS